jgi:hypothetical protein
MFAYFYQITGHNTPVTYLPSWVPQILHISMLISSNRSPQVCQLAPSETATLSHEQAYLNCWQIPWRRDLQKVTVGQLVKKCPAFYEKCSIFAMLTGTRCWFLFCTTPQRICVLQIYLLSIQTFRSHLYLGILRSGLSDQLSVCIFTCYMFCPPHPYCAHCNNNTCSGHRFMWLSL